MMYRIIIIFACVVAFVLSLINLIYYSKARAADGDDSDPANPTSGLTKTESTNMIILNSLVMIVSVFVVFLVIKNCKEIEKNVVSSNPTASSGPPETNPSVVLPGATDEVRAAAAAARDAAANTPSGAQPLSDSNYKYFNSYAGLSASGSYGQKY